LPQFRGVEVPADEDQLGIPLLARLPFALQAATRALIFSRADGGFRMGWSM
jgi:hypothetical protein